ncbi:hypothetical protein [Geminicoccus flavidas]|uniref:hypothetical protein n=1 Tax=Geminicoccus flavidas TaxID=2506407 RepID=UPI0013591761|nr:hypothetical protein [Geminicoccus flavidas]
MSSAEHVHTTSRRTLLAGIAAAPVIGVTAAAPVRHAGSTIAACWQEREALLARRRQLLVQQDGDALDALWTPIFDVEERIAQCRSTSRDDLKIKAALANDLLADAPDEEDIHHPILLSIFRDVERMLLTGVPA